MVEGGDQDGDPDAFGWMIVADKPSRSPRYNCYDRPISSLVGLQISPRVSGHTIPRFGFLPALGGLLECIDDLALSPTLIGKARRAGIRHPNLDRPQPGRPHLIAALPGQVWGR
jgi:hypothetical protein